MVKEQRLKPGYFTLGAFILSFTLGLFFTPWLPSRRSLFLFDWSCFLSLPIMGIGLLLDNYQRMPKRRLLASCIMVLGMLLLMVYIYFERTAR